MRSLWNQSKYKLVLVLLFTACSVSKGTEGERVMELNQAMRRWQKENSTEKICQDLATTRTEE